MTNSIKRFGVDDQAPVSPSQVWARQVALCAADLCSVATESHSGFSLHLERPAALNEHLENALDEILDFHDS